MNEKIVLSLLGVALAISFWFVVTGGADPDDVTAENDTTESQAAATEQAKVVNPAPDAKVPELDTKITAEISVTAEPQTTDIPESSESVAAINSEQVDATNEQTPSSTTTNLAAEEQAALEQTASKNIVVPSSYPVTDAAKYFVPKEERRAGNLGGPPPLNFPGGPSDPNRLPQNTDTGIGTPPPTIGQ